MKAKIAAGSAVIGLAFAAGYFTAGAQAPKPPERTVSFEQTEPPRPPQVSDAERAANVRLVFSYYRRNGDWSDARMLKIMAPNFIQHDVCEPSTEQAYAKLFRDALANGGMPTARGVQTSRGYKDVAGHGLIRSIVADGDLVVVLRDMERRWPNGPVPWLKTTFADIWRVRDGKITEQWATVSPDDGFENMETAGCKFYHDDPPSNPAPRPGESP